MREIRIEKQEQIFSGIFRCLFLANVSALSCFQQLIVKDSMSHNDRSKDLPQTRLFSFESHVKKLITV